MTSISIVMLAKNQERTLPMAMASVIENSDVELILVEPGSTDASRRIILGIQDIFPDADIKLITDPDKGAPDGLNHGLKIAKGPIIGFLNGDDFYLPGALEYVKKFFKESKDTDVLLGSGYIFRESPMFSRMILSSRISLYDIASNSSNFFQQGLFWRLDRFPDINFNPSNISCWDAEIIYDLICAGARFSYVTKCIGAFRIHPTSITGSGAFTEEYIKWKNSKSYEILGRKTNYFDKIYRFLRRMLRHLKLHYLIIINR